MWQFDAEFSGCAAGLAIKKDDDWEFCRCLITEVYLNPLHVPTSG